MSVEGSFATVAEVFYRLDGSKVSRCGFCHSEIDGMYDEKCPSCDGVFAGCVNVDEGTARARKSLKFEVVGGRVALVEQGGPE